MSNEEIKNYLSHIGNVTKFSENIFKVCNGSIGKAIKLQEKIDLYREVENLANLLVNEDIVTVWNNSDILYQSKESISDLLDYINIIFMDELIKTQNQQYINAIEIVEQTKKRLSSNDNYDMSIDYLLLQIWEEFHEKYSRS